MGTIHWLSSLSRRSVVAEGGGFLFVGALTPHDPKTGRLVTATDGLVDAVKAARVGLMFFDVPEGTVIAQTWTIYQLLAHLVKERGLSLQHVVRQRLFIRDIRELPAIERVMDLALGDWRPATSIVVMPSGNIHPDLHIQLDAVVALDRTTVTTLKDGTSFPYPAAVRSGDILFTSSISGLTGPDISALASEDDVRLLRTAQEQRIYAEALRTFANLDGVLRLAGAQVSDLLKVNGWVSFSMREYGAAVLARRRFFNQTKQNMMACTGLTVGGTSDPDALLAFDAIALVPTAGRATKEVRGPASPIASPYVAGAVKGGGLLFTSGEIPVFVPAGEVVATCAQVLDDGRLLRFGHIEPESGMESRAWFVYRTLEAYLRAFDSSFTRVVHQTVFMKDPRQFPTLERIATMFCGNTLPPTTVVPIVDTTPFPTAEIEIELVATTA